MAHTWVLSEQLIFARALVALISSSAERCALCLGPTDLASFNREGRCSEPSGGICTADVLADGRGQRSRQGATFGETAFI